MSCLTFCKSLIVKHLRARGSNFCKQLIVKSLDLLLSFRFCRKITLDLLPSFSFCRKIRFCKSLFIRHLYKQPPCASKSLILSYLQEVSEIQTTRRKIVEKSFTQKVFLFAVRNCKTKSFFIQFEKYFFHQSPLQLPASLQL